jgi:hypothetical protein
MKKTIYDTDQPAFPQEICNDGGNPPFKGLTKREYFAAMALSCGSTPKDAIAKADELLKLLNQTT